MKSFCPFCEKEYDNLEAQTRYEITTLNGVTAEWQKKYIACPDCGEELYNGELHNANLRVLYAACKVSDIYKPVEDLCDYVLKLRMENAELRERLDKAIEPPVKIGDTIYEVCKICDEPCECRYYTCDYPEGEVCHALSLPYGYSSGVCFSTDIVNEECKKHLCVEKQKFNLRFLDDKTGELKPQYFIDREAAEARLKELKEEI